MTPGKKSPTPDGRRRQAPTPAARRRSRERGQRRADILRAAEQVFYRRGFAQTTMDQVAEAAELSKGTLYLYFRNKDDLWVALSSKVVDELLTRFAALAEVPASGIDRVAAMLTAHGEVVAANPEHFRTMVVWMVSSYRADTSTPEFVAHRAKINRIVEAMVGAVELGQRDGSIRRDIDPEQTATHLWAGSLGALQIQINRQELTRRFPQPVDFDDFFPAVVRLLCDGLRSGRPAAPRRRSRPGRPRIQRRTR